MMDRFASPGNVPQINADSFHTNSTIAFRRSTTILMVNVVVLSLLLAVAFAGRLSTYISPAHSLLRLLSGFFTPTFLFLIMNSIIVTIVATTKMNHAEPGGLRNKMKTAEIEVYLNEQIADDVVEQSTFDPREGTPGSSSLEVSAEHAVAELFVYDQDDRKDRKGSLRTAEGNFGKEEVPKTIREQMESSVTKQGHDTLEDVWKAITEKRPPVCVPRENDKVISRAPTLSKAGTIYFPGTSSSRSFQLADQMDLAANNLQRDPSMSADELNRKAEEFISKFTKQIRQECVIQNMQQPIMVDTAIIC